MPSCKGLGSKESLDEPEKDLPSDPMLRSKPMDIHLNLPSEQGLRHDDQVTPHHTPSDLEKGANILTLVKPLNLGVST